MVLPPSRNALLAPRPPCLLASSPLATQKSYQIDNGNCRSKNGQIEAATANLSRRHRRRPAPACGEDGRTTPRRRIAPKHIDDFSSGVVVVVDASIIDDGGRRGGGGGADDDDDDDDDGR